MKLEYVGHACFILEWDNFSVITDPGITDMKLNKNLDDVKVTHVMVSHNHHDHFGDTIEIAKANDATVICNRDLASYIIRPAGIKDISFKTGGTAPTELGPIKMVHAIHGSGVPGGGNACGYVATFGGKTIYFAGDTALTYDMMLLEEYNIDYAFLPIGDYYTMGPKEAVQALKMIKPKHVVPMHYNTSPPTMQDPYKFKAMVEEQTDVIPVIIHPGEVIELD